MVRDRFVDSGVKNREGFKPWCKLSNLWRKFGAVVCLGVTPFAVLAGVKTAGKKWWGSWRGKHTKSCGVESSQGPCHTEDVVVELPLKAEVEPPVHGQCEEQGPWLVSHGQSQPLEEEIPQGRT
eukprot:Gb_32024 [translate_table: standard]